MAKDISSGAGYAISALHTLRCDSTDGGGLVMVSSLGGSEEALTTAIPQSSPKAAAGIARVLIRPLELDLTISPRRKATSELNIRRREIA